MGRGISALVIGLGCALLSSAWPAALTASQETETVVRYVARWDRQESGVQDDLRDVTFRDANLGWAVGANNTILRTDDGGQTWRRLVDRQDRGFEFREVVFLNANEGWVRATNALLYTPDGGQTWRPATQPERNAGAFGGAAMVGSTRFQLYRVNTNFRLARTEDGGNRWANVANRLPWADAQHIFFVDPQRGWLAGQSHQVPPESTLAVTEDGGGTWRVLDQKVYYADPRIQFVNPTTGWVFGEDGSALVATVDGGQTWDRQFTGLPNLSLADMHFLNEPVGHVLGDTIERSGRGTAMRTTDGGQSWQSLGNLGAPSNVRAISFPDLEHGWVVGDRGFIIHYHLVPVIEENRSE